MTEPLRARVAVGEARHSFELALACADAFPLFTPLGETRWVAGWSPEIVTGDGYAPKAGDIFITTTHAHGHRFVWTVVDAETDVDVTAAATDAARSGDPTALRRARVRYLRIAEGFQVGEIEVRCDAITSATTRVEVRYRLTGLGDEGAAHVDEFFAPGAYNAFIDTWRDEIVSALGLHRDA
jgi:hypothetical protein